MCVCVCICICVFILYFVKRLGLVKVNVRVPKCMQMLYNYIFVLVIGISSQSFML